LQRIHARPIPKGDSHSSIVYAARVVPWQNCEACFEVLLTVVQVCGLLLVSVLPYLSFSFLICLFLNVKIISWEEYMVMHKLHEIC